MGKEDLEILENRIREGEKREKEALRARQKELMKKQKVSFWTDFKKFITKGNVLDLAVGVVIGAAFNAIVNGLVKMIINPCIAYFTAGVSLDDLRKVIREADEVEGITELAIEYGQWIQTIIDFLIIALSVFVAVRVIKKMERKIRAKEIAEKEAAAAKKKAEEDAKAAIAKKEAELKAAAEAARQEEYYRNIRRQTELLEKLYEKMNP